MQRQDIFQLIGQNIELKEGLTEFLAANNFEQLNLDYKIISIIGSQSSGKSTILNKCFNCDFEVMKQGKRSQTTKGIHLCPQTDKKCIILDVEGSDSKEHWHDRTMYEQTTGLLALALSHLLMVNIWANDIGKFQASQYSILEVIMEMNLKLCTQKDATKTILFFIREWSADEDIQHATEQITEDLHKIWNEMKKPENFKHLKLEQVFRLEFQTVRSLKYAEKDFKEDVAIIQNRIFSEDQNYSIFSDFDQKKNIKVRDLSKYIEKLWKTIRENKDLNLPSEKKLISSVRCDQIKQDCLDKIKIPLQQLNSRLETGEEFGKSEPTFGERMTEIYTQCIDKYTKEASDYHEEFFQGKRNELQTAIVQQFEECFKKWPSTFKKLHLGNLNTDLAEIEGKLCLDKSENLLGWFQNQLQDAVKQFEKFDKAIQNHLKTSRVEFYNFDLKNVLIGIFDARDQKQRTFIDNQIKELKSLTSLVILQEFSDFLNQTLNQLNKGFWGQLNFKLSAIIKIRRQATENEFSEISFPFLNLEQYLVKLLGGGSLELQLDSIQNLNHSYFSREWISELLDHIQKQVIVGVKDGLRKRKFDMRMFLLKKYKLSFNKDQKGIPRKWKTYAKEEDISDLYQDCRKDIEEIINLLGNINIKLDDNVNPYQSCAPRARRSKVEENEIFFSAAEMTLLSQSLEEEMGDILEVAIRKYNEKNVFQMMPKWMIAIFLYFAHDNVISWFQNSVIVFILTAIICLVGLNYALGLSDKVLKPLRAFNKFNIFDKKEE